MYDDDDRERRFRAFMLSAQPLGVSDEQYRVYRLYYGERMTQRAVAEALNSTSDRVRYLLNKAEQWGARAFERVICPCCNGTGFVPKSGEEE